MGDYQTVVDLGYMYPNEGLLLASAQFGPGATCGPLYSDMYAVVDINESTKLMIFPDCFGPGVTFLVLERKEVCWQSLD
jgi:hypothetical protein